jgi:hypothetical protein
MNKKSKRARGYISILIPIGFEGACHTDELAYLFTREDTPWREQAQDADLKTVDRMTLMWTNFAKHGYGELILFVSRCHFSNKLLELKIYS